LFQHLNAFQEYPNACPLTVISVSPF